MCGADRLGLNGCSLLSWQQLEALVLKEKPDFQQVAEAMTTILSCTYKEAQTMSMKKLKEELKKRNLPSTGVKEELRQRLKDAGGLDEDGDLAREVLDLDDIPPGRC